MVAITAPRRSPEPRPSRRTLLAGAAVAPAALLPTIATAAAIEAALDPDEPDAA